MAAKALVLSATAVFTCLSTIVKATQVFSYSIHICFFFLDEVLI